MSKLKIGIYGYGRFGQLMGNLMKKDFDLYVTNRSDRSDDALKNKVKYIDHKELVNICDVIFICVPISLVESVLKQNKFRDDQTIIDTCSVKEYPVSLMKKYLPESTNIIATHPMFGPDSAGYGVRGLNFVIDNTRCDENTYNYWFKYFSKKKLNMVEITPTQHDKMAAYSQGITHFVGRVLDKMGIVETPIDTLGFKDLLGVQEQTNSDTWQLFCDLQSKNRYTKTMRSKFLNTVVNVSEKLLPKKIKHSKMTIGVQGIEGSYSEFATHEICKMQEITDYDLKYLVGAKPVLKSLLYGDIDRGIIAVQNSTGGMVLETIDAMSEVPCKIQKICSVKISHCLLGLKTLNVNNIERIYSHPQAIKQCKNTLLKMFPNVELIEEVDTAISAKKLAKGDYKKHTAVIASKTAADLYGLNIIKEGVNDLKDNFTDFLIVKRRS